MQPPQPTAALRGSGGDTRPSAVRLFELCTETLRLVKGRRLTAWDLHAALPLHIRVPLGHVTKVMLTACGSAARPAQLQQHKPPPGTGGHIAWSWAEWGAGSAAPVAARYARATAAPCAQPAPRPARATSAAPTPRNPSRGVKRPRASASPLRQADLFASTAAELNDDVTVEAQRMRQANRLHDFVTQHLSKEQQVAAANGAPAEQLQPVTAAMLAGMTPAQVLQEFRRRLDVLGWKQQRELQKSPEGVARSALMLGLPMARSAESKRRFRALARIVHPDKCTLPGALEVFLALQAASHFLSSIDE